MARGPKPAIPIPKQWDIPARAGHIAKLLEMLNRENKIEWDKLLHSKNTKDVREAFCRAKDSHEFKDLWKFSEDGWLILDWVREKKFPKSERRAQMLHLAESIAAPSMIGRGKISLRRSRDLCVAKRRQGTILRVEPHIECSCRYKGPAKDWKCPKCNAEISAADRRLFSEPLL